MQPQSVVASPLQISTSNRTKVGYQKAFLARSVICVLTTKKELGPMCLKIPTLVWQDYERWNIHSSLTTFVAGQSQDFASKQCTAPRVMQFQCSGLAMKDALQADPLLMIKFQRFRLSRSMYNFCIWLISEHWWIISNVVGRTLLWQ